MAINNVTAGTFKGDCKVINLAIEYPGYTGKEKYAIITDLTREELETQYKDIIRWYQPFLVLTREMGLVIKQFQNNEKKHEQRAKRNEHIFDTTNDRDSLLGILCVADTQAQLEAEITHQEFVEATRYALSTLTPLQCEYFIRHYIYGTPIREIARAEHKNFESVREICQTARWKCRKAFDLKGVAA